MEQPGGDRGLSDIGGTIAHMIDARRRAGARPLVALLALQLALHASAYPYMWAMLNGCDDSLPPAPMGMHGAPQQDR